MGYPEEAGVEVAVEWTPAAVLRPLSSSTQRRAEVEVVLTADASALVSSHGGRFFRHLTATKPVREKLFSASAVPQSSLCNLEVRASSRACQPGRETRMLSAGVDHHRHRSWAPHSVWRPTHHIPQDVVGRTQALLHACNVAASVSAAPAAAASVRR
jgi:hypothetical protein